MSDAANYKIKIKEMALYVRKVQLSPVVRMGHVKTLEKTSCKYPVKRVEVKVDTVPTGNMKHYNINFVALNVDGRQIPTKPLQPDFKNNGYIGSYIKAQTFRTFYWVAHYFKVNNITAISSYPFLTLIIHLYNNWLKLIFFFQIIIINDLNYVSFSKLPFNNNETNFQIEQIVFINFS